MSLEQVLKEKTIKNRNMILSNYLKNNIGELSYDDKLIFKHIFEKFYTPDENSIKFKYYQIENILIQKDKYGKKCFVILVDEKYIPTSIKRLSGSNRNDKSNLIRAMRKTIEKQINDFRKLNPLIHSNICPITNEVLGVDAEVDHEYPFHLLASEWLTNNNPSYTYDLINFDYILEEPYYSKWFDFHLKKSILRWVSKNGNKIAHKLFIQSSK